MAFKNDAPPSYPGHLVHLHAHTETEFLHELSAHGHHSWIKTGPEKSKWCRTITPRYLDGDFVCLCLCLSFCLVW